MKKLSKGWWIFIGIVATFWIGIFWNNPEPEPLTVEETKQKLIADQFSPVDGTHYYLEKMVVDNLNDPDSFEHIETRHSVNEDHMLIQMDYRARNGFNALIRKQVVAKADLQTGMILEIVSEK